MQNRLREIERLFKNKKPTNGEFIGSVVGHISLDIEIIQKIREYSKNQKIVNYLLSKGRELIREEEN